MRSMTGPDLTAAEVLTFTPKDVIKVYSGKPGCACGCRGSYRYTGWAFETGEGTKDRGYAVGFDEVNDTQVRKVLNIIQDWARQDPDSLDFGSNYVAIEYETRVYALYPR